MPQGTWLAHVRVYWLGSKSLKAAREPSCWAAVCLVRMAGRDAEAVPGGVVSAALVQAVCVDLVNAAVEDTAVEDGSSVLVGEDGFLGF